MKHFLEYHRKHNTKKSHWKSWNKMEKSSLMFRQAKTHPLNCRVMTSIKITENYLPFDRCFLLHVASFPFRLQYWAMVYSKNATKTNVSQPNIQMSIALERFTSSSCFALLGTIYKSESDCEPFSVKPLSFHVRNARHSRLKSKRFGKGYLGIKWFSNDGNENANDHRKFSN